MKARPRVQNRHKLEELREALPGWEIEPLDADDWPEETGETYYENALLKARFGREPRRAGRLGARRGLGHRVRRARRRARASTPPAGRRGLDQADALLARLEGEPSGARGW